MTRSWKNGCCWVKSYFSSNTCHYRCQVKWLVVSSPDYGNEEFQLHQPQCSEMWPPHQGQECFMKIWCFWLCLLKAECQYCLEQRKWVDVLWPAYLLLMPFILWEMMNQTQALSVTLNFEKGPAWTTTTTNRHYKVYFIFLPQMAKW